MKIDLHSHTTFSDGQLTPIELVQRAQTMQVNVLAITDHDTTNGLDTAHSGVAQYYPALTLIDGVEISTRWHGFDIHIVGLNIDRHDAGLQRFLRDQQSKREARAQRIAEKLAKCGFHDTLERAKRYAREGQITRAHFARVLVDCYSVSSVDVAFKQYLGKGKRAAVNAEWSDIGSAINAIHGAKGRAVLAHPLHYDMTVKWLRRLLNDFKDAKGDAVEVVFPSANPDKQTLLFDLVAEYGFMASAGSDFHMPGKWTELGRCGLKSDTLTPVWHDWMPAKSQSEKL